jgi:hypothetical protein
MFSLILGNLFLVFSLSLEGTNLKGEIVSSSTDFLLNETTLFEDINESYEGILAECGNSEEVILQTSQGEIVIPCEIAEQGTEAIVQEIVNNQVEQSIDKIIEGTECNSPIGCGLELFLSEEASSYMKKLFYIFLFLSLVLITAKFFLSAEKINTPISVGSMIVLSSLPFAVINFTLPYLDNPLLRPIAVLFSGSYSVFVASMTIGIILIVTGFGIKFFMMGKSFSERFSSIKNYFSGKSENIKKIKISD